MANFIGLVYATLKEKGIDTSGMSTDEAVAKFKELQGEGKEEKKDTPEDVKKKLGEKKEEKKEEEPSEVKDKLNGKEPVKMPKEKLKGMDLSLNQKKFFNNSKVVDKNGNLIKLYHGSEQKFDIFNTKNEWGYGGTYFTPDKEVSDVYGENKYEVYLNLEKPLIIDANNKMYDSIEAPEFYKTNNKTVETNELAAWARENGYDGLIVKNVKEAGGKYITDDYIAFYPEQIKSTDNKNPTKNKNIYK